MISDDSETNDRLNVGGSGGNYPTVGERDEESLKSPGFSACSGRLVVL